MKNYFIILILVFALSCTNGQQKEKEIEIETMNTIGSDDSTKKVYCTFKTNQNKECWTRIGVYPIDSISEEYACNLQEENSKHVLLAKYIGDNGAFPNESAFVLWTDSDKEFVKEFYTSGSLDVLQKPKRELNWRSLRVIADSIRIDTVFSRPQIEIMTSHNIGFAVQYNSTETFFCERLQDNQWKSSIDKTHPKVIFWKELTDLLKPTTDR